MVMTNDRQRMRTELVSQGYSWEYIDEWQPKTTLYRHAPGLNINGKEVFPVGTPIKGVPGNPNYALKKAKLGMFPYLPGEKCACMWCSARYPHAEPDAEPVDPAVEKAFVMCQQCGEKVNALTRAGALSRLRVHMKVHRVTE